MGWIKRNFLFVLIAVVALAALGGAGFYIYRSYADNSDKAQNLNGIYANLITLNSGQPQPGTNNTQIAKDEEQQLRAWISQVAGRFNPIPPIPTGELTSKTFATALGTTIYNLTQEAKENSVGLPPQYYFSFQVQNGLLTISSGLGPLAQQLGEVKAITEVLVAARVNNLDAIQRVRVSEDDVAKGLEADYTGKTPITNNLAIITPYVVTFRSFTPELSRVIAGFATSTNPFIIKSISVQPAGNTEAGADTSGPGPDLRYNRYGIPMNGAAGGYPGAARYAGAGRYAGAQRYGPQGMPPGYGPQGAEGQAPANGNRGGLQTVIREQLLKVTMEVDVVRLVLKS
jgi:hypothetical protein